MLWLMINHLLVTLQIHMTILILWYAKSSPKVFFWTKLLWPNQKSRWKNTWQLCGLQKWLYFIKWQAIGNIKILEFIDYFAWNSDLLYSKAFLVKWLCNKYWFRIQNDELIFSVGWIANSEKNTKYCTLGIEINGGQKATRLP